MLIYNKMECCICVGAICYIGQYWMLHPPNSSSSSKFQGFSSLNYFAFMLITKSIHAFSGAICVCNNLWWEICNRMSDDVIIRIPFNQNYYKFNNKILDDLHRWFILPNLENEIHFPYRVNKASKSPNSIANQVCQH